MNSHYSKRLGSLIAGAASLVLVVSPALAQDYPNKPIRFILSVTGGSTTDLVYRAVGTKLSERMGQPVVVENRPGGDHVIAMQMVQQSAPDGYTLLGYVSTVTLMGHTKKDLPFDPIKDFTPITRVATVESVMVVRAELPIRNIAELVAYTKAQGGKSAWSAGVHAASLHVVGEHIKLLTGFQGTHIPYKSGALMVVDMIGGTIPIGMTSIGNVKAQIDAGKLRAILVLQPTKSFAMPELPSTADAGMPQVDSGSWFAVAGPGKMPADILNRLHREIVAVVQLPDVRQTFLKLASPPVTDSIEGFRQRLDNEFQTWGRVIRDAKIKVDG